VVVRQCSVKGRLEETSCDDLIMSSMSLIGTCVKRDFTSKLTSMSVEMLLNFLNFLYEVC